MKRELKLIYFETEDINGKLGVMVYAVRFPIEIAGKLTESQAELLSEAEPIFIPTGYLDTST